MLHSHSYCSKQKNVITSKVCFCIQDSRLYGRYDETGKVWWRIIAIFARVLSIMRWESCSAGGEWEVCTLARSVCRQNTKWFVGILFGFFDVLWYFPVHFFWVYCPDYLNMIWDFVWIISKKKKNVCFECEAALSFYFVFKIFDLFGWFWEFGPSQHNLGICPDHIVMIWDFFRIIKWYPLKRKKTAK